MPANTLILIVDGRKAIILTNAGDSKFPNLKTEWSATDRNPATSDQGADRPGRVQSNGHRSSVEQTDWHEQREVTFAERAGAALDEFVRVKQGRDVIIISPPRTLAVLRRTLSDASALKVIAQLPHDLVNHTIGEIEEFLDRAKAS